MNQTQTRSYNGSTTYIINDKELAKLLLSLPIGKTIEIGNIKLYKTRQKNEPHCASWTAYDNGVIKSLFDLLDGFYKCGIVYHYNTEIHYEDIRISNITFKIIDVEIDVSKDDVRDFEERVTKKYNIDKMFYKVDHDKDKYITYNTYYIIINSCHYMLLKYLLSLYASHVFI